MAISAMSGIPYGTQMSSTKNPHEAVRTIVSDGRVDDAFVRQDPSFIGDIKDSRIQEFLKSGAAPGEAWKAHELGGFDSPHQSLFVESEKVVLRSNLESHGETVRHLITAPFDKATGEVSLERSSEGFNIVKPQSPGGHTAHFSIPL